MLFLLESFVTCTGFGKLKTQKRNPYKLLKINNINIKKEDKMVWYNKTALVLANIGAINWGLNALGWNAVDKLIGSWAGASVATIVYYIIALCGICLFIGLK